jgi:hypothetical protein
MVFEVPSRIEAMVLGFLGGCPSKGTDPAPLISGASALNRSFCVTPDGYPKNVILPGLMELQVA